MTVAQQTQELTVAEPETVSGEVVQTARFFRFGSSRGEQQIVVNPTSTVLDVLLATGMTREEVVRGEAMVNGTEADLDTPVAPDSLVVFSHNVKGG